MDLRDLGTHELLRLFSNVLDELRRRGTIRSTNNPVADYAEHIVAEGLSLMLVQKSTAGYDAVDAQGQRYEVKARRLTPQNKSTQLSAIRSLDEQHFSYLAGVLFNADFSVRRACLVPYEVVRQEAVYRSHVNAWILHLRDRIWDIPGVQDITLALVQVQTADRSQFSLDH